MRFNNRESEFVTTTDGRRFYISRSCAVVLNVICLLRKPGAFGEQTIPYVLINKRGPGCPDNIGMWVLPAGYLDWNESGNEAAIRETWEECGFNLLAATEDSSKSLGRGKYSFLNDIRTDQPWRVMTHPRNSKQNIVLNYGVRFEADELPHVHANNNQDEVVEVKWIQVSDAIKMKLAFNHQETIAEYSLVSY